jgi:hypothetical protein
MITATNLGLTACSIHGDQIDVLGGLPPVPRKIKQNAVPIVHSAKESTQSSLHISQGTVSLPGNSVATVGQQLLHIVCVVNTLLEGVHLAVRAVSNNQGPVNGLSSNVEYEIGVGPSLQVSLSEKASPDSHEKDEVGQGAYAVHVRGLRQSVRPRIWPSRDDVAHPRMPLDARM